jgi:hypothetical protein
MRKVVMILSAVAALAVATPASAKTIKAPAYPWIAGAAVGTAAGVALYNGWWTGSTVGKAIGASAVGSAAAGFVIGVGTIALIDAATQPCKGFRALFSPFYNQPSGCVNGKYVGYAPRKKAKRG